MMMSLKPRVQTSSLPRENDELYIPAVRLSIVNSQDLEDGQGQEVAGRHYGRQCPLFSWCVLRCYLVVASWCSPFERESDLTSIKVRVVSPALKHKEIKGIPQSCSRRRLHRNCQLFNHRLTSRRRGSPLYPPLIAFSKGQQDSEDIEFDACDCR